MIDIPSVASIRDDIVADIEGKIGQTVPAVSRAFFRVLATALAGPVHLLYRVAAWVYRQIFPQTADAEALQFIGDTYGITRKASTAWTGTATATGTIEETTIPAGTLWTRGEYVYMQDAAVDISAGSATVALTALTPGAAATLSAGDIVTIGSPIGGIDDTATIATTATEGEDEEAIEDYRARVITRMRQRPQGGATPDYIIWAGEVAGIVKAFAFRTDTSEVTVYPLQSLTTDRIPDASKLAEVQAYLSDPIRRPLCATVFAAAMTERQANITVSSLSPDTSAIRSAVSAAWETYLLKAFPRQYDDEANPTNVVTIAGLYREAFNAGATSIVIVLNIAGGGSGVSAYTLLDSEIIKLGAVTWPA